MSQSNCTAEQAIDREHLEEVAAELERARAKFGAIASLHEGYAVILEELEEFWEGVKTKGTHPEAMRLELIQIAAMAIRTATDRLVP